MGEREREREKGRSGGRVVVGEISIDNLSADRQQESSNIFRFQRQQ